MNRKIIALYTVLVVFLAAGGWFVFGRTDRHTTVHADFSYINGIYPGSKVTVLGVPVGRVTDVQPRGTTVRVTMTVPTDVVLPAQLDAYVMSPALISDRSVELGPAYSGHGPTVTDGQIIATDHTHAPITFDSLLDSIGVLTRSIGPDHGDIGEVIARGADQWQGQGPKFNTAVRNLSAATGVLGARSSDIDAVVGDLSELMTAFKRRQVSLNTMVDALGQLGGSWAEQNLDITGPMRDLRVVLDQVHTFVGGHGDQLGSIATNLNAVGALMAAKQPGLAEFMDLVPLMMQNLSNTVGPDRRGRVRINVSTVLTQFAAARNFCDTYQLPMCVGTGITNPISYPISRSDPLGIVSAISTITGNSGIIPPPNPNYPR